MVTCYSKMNTMLTNFFLFPFLLIIYQTSILMLISTLPSLVLRSWPVALSSIFLLQHCCNESMSSPNKMQAQYVKTICDWLALQTCCIWVSQSQITDGDGLPWTCVWDTLQYNSSEGLALAELQAQLMESRNESKDFVMHSKQS